jgi:hypothetical protein
MAVTPNYGWPVPVATDLVKDGYAAIADLGDAIDATVFGLGGSPDTVLSSGTFTAVSALNLSSVLSDTYDFYTLNLYAKVAAGTPLLNLRFRENTTDFTGANYQVSGIIQRVDGTVGNFWSGNFITQISLTTLGTATNGTVQIDITRPSAAQGTIRYNAWDTPNVWAQLGQANNHGVTNFNGISIYPASSTMTGYYMLTGRKA